MKRHKSILAGCILVGAISLFCAVGNPSVKAATADPAQENYEYAQQSDNGAEGIGYGDLSDTIMHGGLFQENASLAATTTFKYESKIVAGIKKFSTKINVKGMGITTGNVASICNGIVNNHPELVYVQSYVYQFDNSGKVTSLKFIYDSNARDEKEQLEKAVARVNKAVNIKGMTDEEIVLAYHEYLTSTVEYDYYDYINNTLGSEHEYDMYGVLVNKSAVCQGYAETLWYFLKKAGIPCGMATSVNVNHAWNVVQINGKWYHVDATWDDPAQDLPGRSLHSYFLVSYDTMNKLTLASSSNDRSDMVVGSVWKGTYKKAVDKKYESGQMWTGVNKVIWYRNNYWYSIRQSPDDDTYYQIIKSSYRNHTNIIWVNQKELWPSTTGGYYPGQYGSIFLVQETLYFCTGRMVYSIDLDAAKPVCKAAGYIDDSQYDPEINIYGMGYSKGKAVYVLSNEPTTTKRLVGTLKVCLQHVWDAGTVKKAATYTSMGEKEYTCVDCQYIKKTTIPKLTLAKINVKTANVNSGVKLTWNRESKATGYKIYRRTGKGRYSLIKTVRNRSICSMVNTKVKSGVSYTYKVVAYNNYVTGQGSAKSQYCIGTVKAKTRSTATGIKVTWNKLKGAGGYKIYRKLKGGKYKLIKISGSSASAYIDRGVKKGKTYYYYVKPYRNSTAGTYSVSSVKFRK